MQKLFLQLGGIIGALSVVIGAFGAHGLKDYLLKTERLEVFETAVKYQFYHVFALIVVALLMDSYDQKLLTYSGFSFLAGIVVFSGSLYALIGTQITKFGAVTPIGGLLLIAGWVLMVLAVNKG